MGFRKFKPRRGGARRFTPTRELAAQDRRRREEGEEEEDTDATSGEGEGSTTTTTDGTEGEEDSDSETEGEEVGRSTGRREELNKRMASVKVAQNQSASSEEDVAAQTKQSTGKNVHPPQSSNIGTAQKAFSELSRREREVIEKERARQYYLLKKQEEDAKRLTEIRARREEEARKAEQERKDKEAARMQRR